MVNCGLARNRGRPECRVVLRNRCMSRPVNRMSTQQTRRCINTLLFRPPKNLRATDPELLSIVVLKSKRRHFKFLEGKTRWGVIGDWIDPKTGKPYPKESNVQMDIQFLDRKDEMIGKRLKRLLINYNKKVVKEELLYFRTHALEETSLT